MLSHRLPIAITICLCLLAGPAVAQETIEAPAFDTQYSPRLIDTPMALAEVTVTIE